MSPPRGGLLQVAMTKAKKITSRGKTCKATRTDGEPCRAPAQVGRDYCFFHDPEQIEDRITASRKGGLVRRGRRVELPRAESLEPEEAREVLAGVIEATITGALDPGTARTVGYLLQIEAKIREGYDFEKRLAAIEETLKKTQGEKL